MTLFEKITIPLFLLGGVALIGAPFLREWFWIPDKSIGVATLATFFSLCIFYLLKTKPSIYSLSYALLSIWPVWAIFTLFHWEGFMIFFPLVLITGITISGILIWSGIRCFKYQKELALFFFALGLVILVQSAYFLIPFFWQRTFHIENLDYVLLVGILAIKTRGKDIQLPENRTLTLLGLQAVLFVLSDAVQIVVRHPLFE